MGMFGAGTFGVGMFGAETFVMGMFSAGMFGPVIYVHLISCPKKLSM